LAVHDEAVSRLTKPKASGNLRIGLTDYFIPEILPNLFSRFWKQYSNIHLEIQTGVGINLIPLFEKGELDLVVAGKDAYQGSCRVLTQEPLIWVVGKDTDATLHETTPLVLLPSPCYLRQIATESLEKANRQWEVLFTGTSIAGVRSAVQAGIGLSILPTGALKEGLRRAPSHLELPELPMYALALIADEQSPNDARDVFIPYLEAELNNLN
jgi:DNA-binding transcriptional LysR family regulator